MADVCWRYRQSREKKESYSRNGQVGTEKGKIGLYIGEARHLGLSSILAGAGLLESSRRGWTEDVGEGKVPYLGREP